MQTSIVLEPRQAQVPLAVMSDLGTVTYEHIVSSIDVLASFMAILAFMWPPIHRLDFLRWKKEVEEGYWSQPISGLVLQADC